MPVLPESSDLHSPVTELTRDWDMLTEADRREWVADFYRDFHEHPDFVTSVSPRYLPFDAVYAVNAYRVEQDHAALRNRVDAEPELRDTLDYLREITTREIPAQLLHYELTENPDKKGKTEVLISQVHGDLSSRNTDMVVTRPLGMTATAHPSPKGENNVSGWLYTERESQAILDQLPENAAVITSLHQHPPGDIFSAMRTEHAKVGGRVIKGDLDDVIVRMPRSRKEIFIGAQAYSYGAGFIAASIAEGMHYNLVKFDEAPGLAARPERDRAGEVVRDDEGNIVWARRAGGTLPALVTELEQLGPAVAGTAFMATDSPDSFTATAGALGRRPLKMKGVAAVQPVTKQDLIEQRAWARKQKGAQSRFEYRVYAMHAASHRPGTSANELLGEAMRAAHQAWKAHESPQEAVNGVAAKYRTTNPDTARAELSLRAASTVIATLGLPASRVVQVLNGDVRSPNLSRRRPPRPPGASGSAQRPDSPPTRPTPTPSGAPNL